MTDSCSLYEILTWIAEMERLTRTEDEHRVNFLVGNKLDLSEHVSVDVREVKKFAKDHNLISGFQVSAKTGAGVAELLQAVAEALVEKIVFDLAYDRQKAAGRSLSLSSSTGSTCTTEDVRCYKRGCCK